MEYLVTAQEMRRYDLNTSAYFKVPSIVLMERAALACLEVLKERQKQLENAVSGFGMKASRRVLVVAGCGNNGGDGFALGRLLMQEGFLVDFVLIGDDDRVTQQTGQQMESVLAYGGFIMRNLPDREYDIIIDALFGVGLTRPLEGIFRESVEYINRQNAFVLSVDIPSGIHADTGSVLGTAVFADITVTFGFEKLGTFLYPGARHAGKVICCSIGITQDSFLGEVPGIFTFREPVRSLMPCRMEEGNKGTFGKAALLCGSEGMAGAGVLCAGGAFAAGCGMVKLISPVSNRELFLQILPEAMVSDEIETVRDWADVIAAGPGLSVDGCARQKLVWVIRNTRQPLILDADAINILAQDRELLQELIELQSRPGTCRKLALTPHPGELARLCRCSTKEILKDPVPKIREWAARLNAVVLCKGARTFVASPDGRVYANGSGNSGMATAGSGDVLTGIIAAVAGQEEDLFWAVCVGVYLHGLAGDKAAHEKSEYSMKAGDIVDKVSELLR